MGRVWLTWEDHRRSRELSKVFSCRYIVISSNGRGGLKLIKNIVKTILVVFENRNSVIFVQNPSRILGGLTALLKIVFRFTLVVDRHTNFRIGKGISFDPRIWFVILCSEFSLRVADLTIVTNNFLKDLVDNKGGFSLVLPDRIPEISSFDSSQNVFDGRKGLGDKVVVFICTFADDEPFIEVIRAAELWPDNVKLYVTGKYNDKILNKIGAIPKNVILTGFIPDSEYEALLQRANVIVDFTTLDWCLVCGGYEAMSVKKPLITSATQALIEFYGEGALFSDHSPRDIAEKVTYAINNEGELSSRLIERSVHIKSDWEDKKRAIDRFLLSL